MTSEESKKVNDENSQATNEKEAEAPSVEKVEKEAAPAAAAKVDAEVENKESEEAAPAVEETVAADAGETAKEAEKKDLFQEFTVEVKKEEIESSFNETLDKYASEVRMPGFRKGKAPLELIKSRLKESIMEEVKGKMVEEAVFKKITEEKMKILSPPMIKDIRFEEGSDLAADVMVEVFPEITLPDFETLEVEVPAKEMEQEPYDEAKTVERFLQSRQRRVPVTDREIKEDDHLMLNYQSKILATKRMTPRKDGNYTVTKEFNFDITDLFDEVLGKKLNDKITVTRTYPEDYSKKAWAGKELEHYIEIKGIQENVTPELDEAFLKASGFKDEVEFKEKLKNEYEQYLKQQLEEKKFSFIIEKLNETVDFPLPQSMVEQEMSRMLPQGANFDPNNPEVRQIMELMRGNAEKSVRFALIIESAEAALDVDVTVDDLEEAYKRAAESSRVDIKEVRRHYMKKENMSQLKQSLKREKTIELMKEKIQIKEV